MTGFERKRIENALKYIERKKTVFRKKYSLHKWGLMTTIFSPEFYDKAAKKLGSEMFAPIVEFFNGAEDNTQETLIVILHRLYKFYKIEKIPEYLIDIILDSSFSTNVRKSAARMLTTCFAKISLNTIKEIYSIKEFQFDALTCLPFCDDTGRHEFAIDVLNKLPSPQMTEYAVRALTADKITLDDMGLLKLLYAQCKNPHLRYSIMELLYKSPQTGLENFFLTAYKKERLLPSRLQAIIGLCIKSNIEQADTIMYEFIDAIKKRSFTDARTLGDLRSVAEQVEELIKTYPSKGFLYANDVLSNLDVLQDKKSTGIAGVFRLK